MILGRDVCKQFSKKKINQNYTEFIFTLKIEIPAGAGMG